jgi:formamidopyrimidine-DNA glycosylase
LALVPELTEVEGYRRLAAAKALERVVSDVSAPDGWWLKNGLTERSLRLALKGRRFVAARRTGKVLFLDTSDDGAVVALRFGMTGRLLVDGQNRMGNLKFSPNADKPKWARLRIDFEDGGEMRVTDPRRLGGIALDPDESRLGEDALGLTLDRLRSVLEGSEAPLKYRLMDQRRLGGIGNLMADEMLFRAGLRPNRPAGGLTDAELRRLHRHVVKTMDDLMQRGASSSGDFMPFRHRGGRCPKDGAELVRTEVGGRTTWYCPEHQV